MSFSLTQSEKNRVEVASVLGMHLDPIGKADLVMIIVISAVYAADLVSVLYLIANRNYPPLKSKSPMLMVAAFVSSVAWYCGDLVTNGHIHLSGTVMANCKAFGVWVRVLLGVCTISSLIALRSYGLYRVFRMNLPYRGLGFYLPFMIYCACLLVYGIVSQVLSTDVTVKYVGLMDLCYYYDGFKASLFVFIWVTWLIVAYINWKIRNIKSSFNESREMALSCFVVFAILTFTTIMHYTHPMYPLSRTLRLLTTSLDHVATNVVWWSIMGTPLFNCLFRKQRYLEMWKRKLRQDGLQREYQIDSGTVQGGTIVGSTVPLNSRVRDTYLYANKANAFYPIENSQKCLADAKLSLDTSLHRYRPDSPTMDRLYSGSSFDTQPVTPTTAVASPVLEDPFLRRSGSNGGMHRNSRTLRRKHRDNHSSVPAETQPQPSSPRVLQMNTGELELQPYSPIEFPEPAQLSSLRWQGDSEDEVRYGENQRHII